MRKRPIGETQKPGSREQPKGGRPPREGTLRGRQGDRRLQEGPIGCCQHDSGGKSEHPLEQRTMTEPANRNQRRSGRGERESPHARNQRLEWGG